MHGIEKEWELPDTFLEGHKLSYQGPIIMTSFNLIYLLVVSVSK